jgi:hypothetical protein
MTRKPKLINTLSLVFTFVFITVIFILLAYENKCHILSCSPASWEKILDTALAQSGKDFRVSSISIHPSWRSSYTENGPTVVAITVMCVSLHADSSQTNGIAGKIANHPLKWLILDDQDLITIVSRNGWTSDVPPEDRQEKLQRVIVSPHDAFRTTWGLAKKESGLSSDDIGALAVLSFDTRGYESIWEVSYVYDKTVLTFYVNAQTGQVISTEKSIVSR